VTCLSLCSSSSLSLCSFAKFPCAQKQGNLTVALTGPCSANFTLPTPLTCRDPGVKLTHQGATKIVLTEN
jgi:hypothetical protein